MAGDSRFRPNRDPVAAAAEREDLRATSGVERHHLLAYRERLEYNATTVRDTDTFRKSVRRRNDERGLRRKRSNKISSMQQPQRYSKLGHRVVLRRRPRPNNSQLREQQAVDL